MFCQMVPWASTRNNHVIGLEICGDLMSLQVLSLQHGIFPQLNLFGDQPLPETVALVEDIVVEYVTDFVSTSVVAFAFVLRGIKKLCCCLEMHRHIKRRILDQRGESFLLRTFFT